jgi:hypothetical protein
VSGPAAGYREPWGGHQSSTVLGLFFLEMEDHAMQVVIEPGC